MILEIASSPYIEDDSTYVPYKGRAETIRKVYEKVIDGIIGHLELTFVAERPPPPRVLQQELLMAAKEMGRSLTLSF